MAEQDYKRLGCGVLGCESDSRTKGLCKPHYMRMRRSGQPEPVQNAQKQCRSCSGFFVPTRAADYCSSACKVKEWRLLNPDRYVQHRVNAPKAPQFCAVSFNTCRDCGTEWTARHKKTRCVPCDMAMSKRSAEKSSRARHQHSAKTLTCDECRQTYCPLYGFKPGPTPLCIVCKPLRARLRKTIDKAFRRGRMRAAEAEPVNPHKVFARDGWLCRLCGIETPKVLRGTCEHNAPELDHSVPLSRHGPHTYANTQCLCRSCNQFKSDRTMVEVHALLAA